MQLIGKRVPIVHEKSFANLGASHAAAHGIEIQKSYPYLLAQKFNIGYEDFSYTFTAVEYSQKVLENLDLSSYEFVIWQFSDPWRKHNFDHVGNPHDARGYESSNSWKQAFLKYATVLKKYKDQKVFFYFINTDYIDYFFDDLLKINSNLHPENFKLLDYCYGDNVHGGHLTQQYIANSLFTFIKERL